jgi:hypothetical protein
MGSFDPPPVKSEEFKFGSLVHEAAAALADVDVPQIVALVVAW